MTIFCFLKLAFIKIVSASPNGDYRLTLTVALPDGIFYAEDSTLYWMVRSINDTGISIDENALLAYRDTCEAYIADEQSKCGYSAVVVELLSLKECADRNDIGVEVYVIGTVWTSNSPEELLESWAGGGYFDGELRLHLDDGNSAMFNMLVVDRTPVGFLSWDGIDATKSQKFNSINVKST